MRGIILMGVALIVLSLSAYAHDENGTGTNSYAPALEPSSEGVTIPFWAVGVFFVVITVFAVSMGYFSNPAKKN